MKKNYTTQKEYKLIVFVNREIARHCDQTCFLFFGAITTRKTIHLTHKETETSTFFVISQLAGILKELAE